MTFRNNTLDPKNDIRGTDSQDSSLDITEESLKLGSPVSGSSGSGASIIVVSGVVSVSGLSGINTNDSLGRFITLSGANSGANNGTFQIIDVISSSSIIIDNVLASTDSNNGSISWQERNTYSLESNINYILSDRRNIKGVDFDQPIPTYERPDNVGIPVDANLANISGKTTDATTIIENIKYEDASISTGDGYITLFGSFVHAKSSNILGIPIYDGYDAGNDNSTYVAIFADGYSIPTVLFGPNQGNRIFGRTRAGITGIDGSSIEVELLSVSLGDPISSAVVYTWESGQSSSIDLFYGERKRLDQADESRLRTEYVEGLFGGSSGASSGVAGGDLDGTYPNPQVVDLTISGAVHGSILYRGSSNWVHLAPGPDGYFLQTKDVGDAPQWVQGASGPPSGPAGGDLSGTYPNPDVVNFTILGEEAGSILYYDGYDWVSLGAGSDGYVLVSNGLGLAPEWSEISSGFDTAQHSALRQLIHLADGGGPFEEFASGAYKETILEDNVFPISVIWYNSDSKTNKIIEKTIIRNPNKTPSTIEWKVYDTDGSTVLATVSDSISYLGVVETDRTRTVS